MGIRLIKKQVSYKTKDNKENTFYSFYLQLDNGMQIKIQPNSYENAEGEKISNYRDLVLIADDELPFDR